MLSGATSMRVATASHSNRYSPKACASSVRVSTIGSRNCSA
jgi:hypothetical protein